MALLETDRRSLARASGPAGLSRPGNTFAAQFGGAHTVADITAPPSMLKHYVAPIEYRGPRPGRRETGSGSRSSYLDSLGCSCQN